MPKAVETTVLLTRARWKAMQEYIDDLECSMDALKVELALVRGEDTIERLTSVKLKEWLRADDEPEQRTC